MTRYEATGYNVVLRWALGLPWTSGLTPTVDEAREAAVQLADRARSTLGGGLTGEDVRGHWPARGVPAVSATARLYRTPGAGTVLLSEQAPGPDALMRVRVVVPFPHSEDVTAGALAADLDTRAVAAVLGDWTAWLITAGGVQ